MAFLLNDLFFPKVDPFTASLLSAFSLPPNVLNNFLANLIPVQMEFEEIKITSDELKQEMITKSNGRMTVPQIFIGDFHVGGCDDLYALESAGKLNNLLGK